jgi:nitrogen PTS system EIIA component
MKLIYATSVLRRIGLTRFMDLGDLIKPEAVVTGLRAQTKRALLSELSQRAGELLKIDQSLITEAVLQREMLSSTGLGRGIAIPHARMKSVRSMFGLFARLEHPIPFDAMDGEPVDLVFLLLAPDGAGADHLRALARVSRLMRDAPTLERLRGSSNRNALYSVLTEPMTSNAA